MERCQECGLPLVECSALSIARSEVREYLRERGYTGLQAKEVSERLILHPKRGDREIISEEIRK